jgi:uncharacterized membrane protein YiaA
MEAKYIQLASSYSDFLAALAGASITVLTLVLTLGKPNEKDKENKKGLFFALVAALSVATAACFVGAHLMTETPTVFIQDEPESLKWMLLSVLVLVEVGAFTWMRICASTFLKPYGNTAFWWASIAAILYAVIWLFNTTGADPHRQFFPTPFAVCLVAAVATLVFYAVRTGQTPSAPVLPDTLFYCVGMVLPSAAIIFLALRQFSKDVRGGEEGDGRHPKKNTD